MEMLRWGILGCAAIAERAVVPAIHQSTKNEIVAVASRNTEKAMQFAEKNSIPHFYNSYEALLADETIEAVYIPLPNHLHKEWTIKALEAGKHVLCEKPITLTAAEAEEIAVASKTFCKIAVEAFMYRYHERYKVARELIDSGAIGDIRLFRGSFSFNSSSKTEDVRYVREWGGGSLYDVGCYPISAARLLLQAEPTAVTMQGLYSKAHGDVDMFTSGLLEFPNEVAVLIDCGMWGVFRNEVEVVGTEGVLHIPHAFVPSNDEQCAIHISKEDKTKTYPVPYQNNYVTQVDLFAHYVRLGEPLPYTIEDSVANMKVLEAALLSADTHTRIVMK